MKCINKLRGQIAEFLFFIWWYISPPFCKTD
jgi:hypothetical protein